MKLFYPTSYTSASKECKSKICNGCGSKGLGGFFVPNTLWGLSIEDACNIHDWMYSEGTTLEEKDLADRVFLNNMIRIIDEKSSPLLRGLRRFRAKNYYRVVKYFGGPAFWADKES